MEMVKLFQLQLEHYEKVEGTTLSLEGKANQLSLMVRGNLPAAMQGLVVVPIFAGYDTRRRRAACSTYDVTGGRYEERDYVATGSGSLHAGTVDQGRLPRRAAAATRPSTCACGRCGRRPTPTRPPAAPTRCGASTRSSPPSPPTASSAMTEPSWPSARAIERARGAVRLRCAACAPRDTEVAQP